MEKRLDGSMSSEKNGRSTSIYDDVSSKLMPPPPAPPSTSFTAMKSSGAADSGAKSSRIVFIVDKNKLKDLGIQSKINNAMFKMNSSE